MTSSFTLCKTSWNIQWSIPKLLNSCYNSWWNALKRYFGNKILKFICLAFFHTNLSTVCANWGQYIIFVLLYRLGIAGGNALEITCFTNFNYDTAQLIHKMKNIKFTDRYNHQTGFPANSLLILPSCITSKFDTKAV